MYQQMKAALGLARHALISAAQAARRGDHSRQVDELAKLIQQAKHLAELAGREYDLLKKYAQ